MNKISSMTVAAAALVVCLFAAREADACACPAVPPADPSGNYTDGDNELRTLVEDALKHASAVFTGKTMQLLGPPLESHDDRKGLELKGS